MQYSLALLALVAAVSAAPQGVTSAISPSSSAPSGCVASYSGKFEIETVNATSTKKRGLEARADALIITLSNGVLTDSAGRTGYIAANSQFQFDDPPQTGAIYTAGWSVCANGSLAIGDTALFKQCLSGSFYNLYLDNTAAQCSSIYIDIVPYTDSTSTTSASSGAVVAATVLSDGQVQATTAAVVTQISDGQIQATTAKTTTTAAVVTQISDGQVQATTAKTAATSASASASSSVTTTNASATSSTTRTSTSYTGAAVPTAVRGEFFGLAIGALAVALI